MATKHDVALWVPCHYSKGNQASKDPIDRIAGAGAFARAADGVVLMSEQADKESKSYVMDFVLGRHGDIAPFVVTLNWPLLTVNEGLKPVIKRLGRKGAEMKYDEEMLLKCLKVGMTTGEHFKAALKEYGMSRATFNRLRESLEKNRRLTKRGWKWSRAIDADGRKEAEEVRQRNGHAERATLELK